MDRTNSKHAGEDHREQFRGAPAPHQRAWRAPHRAPPRRRHLAGAQDALRCVLRPALPRTRCGHAGQAAGSPKPRSICTSSAVPVFDLT
jgi:hypothetical protein